MAAVAPGGPGAPAAPGFNQASINRYAGSSPVNYRLLLANLLLLGGCGYVLFTSLSAYELALSDFDSVARTSTVGISPCGLSVPNTRFLMQTLKEEADDAFSEIKEKPLVERVRGALCGSDSITDALRMALQTTSIPDSCCSDTVDIDEKVRTYLCACDTQGCQSEHGFGDILRRIQHAYVLSSLAFARYVDSGSPLCTGNRDPFGSEVCPLDSARSKVISELNAGANNGFAILAGASSAEAAWPTEAEMLYRIFAISVIEYYDRLENDGMCFRNTDSSHESLAFCQSILSNSIAKRSIGTPASGGCANASAQLYYDTRVRLGDSCTYTSDALKASQDGRSNKPSDLTKQPPVRIRSFTSEYPSLEPVLGVCVSMHEFGQLDRRRLFGLPDPVGDFEWFGDRGNGFTRWLAGWSYWSLFDSNRKKIVAPTHTAYLDLKLYSGYRFASTTAWVMAAVISCGYLIAYAVVPFVKLLYIRLVRRNLTNSATQTIVLRPPGSAEFAALVVALLTGLWILFVDPQNYSPVPFRTSCVDYDVVGGAFGSTQTRLRDGLTGLVLVVLAVFVLLYLACCRRPPRRFRIIPLQPFPLWPVFALITVALVAMLILLVRVGDDWWSSEANEQTGSNEKLTGDFEEIIVACIWGLFFLALLIGILAQRHMAANAALEVPIGRPPIFAYLWCAAGFAAAIIAAVFVWPLFDCQIQFETNSLICGDGTETTVRFEYFWGCVAFLSCIAAVGFVFFASYRVLFSVPRKKNQAAGAFSATKTQQLAALRSSGALAALGLAGGNLPTRAEVPSNVVSATFVAGVGDEGSPLLPVTSKS